MTKKTLFMGTTEVPAEKTAAEISGVLIAAGATQIATEYETGNITGLRWTMRVYGRELLFQMPVRVEPVYRILEKQRRDVLSTGDKAKLKARAHRVAWRQLLRWVQAQMAMIECGMAETTEVFLPYLQTGSGRSFFEALKGSGFKQIAPPEDNGPSVPQ